MTWSQEANTFSKSPWLEESVATRFLWLSAPTGHKAFQFSSGWTKMLLSFAFVKSRTGVKTWYFTLIIFKARSTTFSLIPATIATASPTKRTLWSKIPGIFWALETSISSIKAWACGDLNTFTTKQSWLVMSST